MCTAGCGVQENHVRPALVLWLTFPRTAGAASAERRAALQNLTTAGLPVVVPAGFARTDAGTDDPLDACTLDIAGDAAALTVSATDRLDALATGACVSLRCGGRHAGYKHHRGATSGRSRNVTAAATARHLCRAPWRFGV